jgi:hypothetical protein
MQHGECRQQVRRETGDGRHIKSETPTPERTTLLTTDPTKACAVHLVNCPTPPGFVQSQKFRTFPIPRNSLMPHCFQPWGLSPSAQPEFSPPYTSLRMTTQSIEPTTAPAPPEKEARLRSALPRQSPQGRRVWAEHRRFVPPSSIRNSLNPWTPPRLASFVPNAISSSTPNASSSSQPAAAPPRTTPPDPSESRASCIRPPDLLSALSPKFKDKS